MHESESADAAMELTGLERTAIWLLPAAGDEAALAECIRTLAQRYGGPPFDPHVTVFAGTMAETPAWRERLQHIAMGVAPFNAAIQRAHHAAAFTRALHLRLAPHPLFEALHRRARSFSRGPGRYILEPHLSLLYATLPESERQAAAAGLDRGLSAVSFDRLRAVRVGPRTSSREDVESWRTLAAVRLEA